MKEKIEGYLDKQGRISTWPAKQRKKIAVLEYLGTKFEEERIYTEKEINEEIQRWHNFEDYFLLRRGLIDLKILSRTKDGREYRKLPQEEKENQEI